MKWRVIEMEACDAYMNMDIEEAAWEGVRNGPSPPTIRFYCYKPCVVSIGCLQSIRDEVNLKCAKIQASTSSEDGQAEEQCITTRK